MRRRYWVLALAIVPLVLLNLIWQDEPAGSTGAEASQSSASPQQAMSASLEPISADAPSSVVTSSQTPAPAPSWRALPQEAEERLASEIQESDQPLDERLENLINVEAQWPSEGESLTLLQGRYAEALAQLASESEQLTLTERLAALTRLQDAWAAQYPDLAADLFNPDARLLQARQLWGDEELETLARHFLPAERAEASLGFARARQQQLDQRGRYQQQLAELEQQLAASQGNMDSARWQQHREEVLGQFRRDFFAQEQTSP
ncbi:MAG: hypothetical protein ACRCYW_17730 [Aeromonas sp.]|uniref:hypothetical protein n=1 Tax=Aeromonas sp. TaxID=647 RepID=UPI003F2E4440